MIFRFICKQDKGVVKDVKKMLARRSGAWFKNTLFVAAAKAAVQ